MSNGFEVAGIAENEDEATNMYSILTILVKVLITLKPST